MTEYKTLLFMILAPLYSPNIADDPTYTLAGLFPVSNEDKDAGSTADANGLPHCTVFQNDGWYMLLAMDFAAEAINSHPDFQLKINVIKIDTCGPSDKNFWFPHFLEVVQNDQYTVTGVVGASYSVNSKTAGHISTVFDIPMISYQSSATFLSDTEFFPYFYRTIPIDNLQTLALRHLLVKTNLTYIALFYDSSSYGVGLKEMLVNDSEGEGLSKICLLEGGFMIKNDDPFYNYEEEVESIVNDDAVKAIAVLGYKADLEKVTNAFKAAKQDLNNYIWIATDGWAQFDKVLETDKVIGTTFSAGILADFRDFYNKKMTNIENNVAQYHVDDQTYQIYQKFINNADFKKVLHMEALTENKINYITYVVEAMVAYAEALNIKGDQTLSERLENLSFNVSKVFKFNENDDGSLPSSCKKLTHGKKSYGAYDYIAYSDAASIKSWNVGDWDNEGGDETPNIKYEEIDKLVESWNMTNIYSQCFQCPPGSVQDTSSTQCCNECKECDTLSQYTNSSDNKQCYNCSESQRALPSRMGCEDIIPTHIMYTSPLESTILFFSCLGIVCVSVTYWYMFVYTYTPIARASGRSYMLLVAICNCIVFISPVLLFAVPSRLVCILQRVIIAGPTVGIIAACLVRTFSIDRIFRQPGVRQRLLSQRLVMMIIGFLIGIELFIESIIMVSMPSTPLNVTKIPYESRILECEMPKEDIMLTFIFPGMLTLLCAIFALRIRKVPSNYNESRYIIFTITILFFESITFFMIFKNLEYNQYIQYSVICIIVGDFMTYFALFLPRLYIILFKPERNTLQLQCTGPNGQCISSKTMDRGCNTSSSMNEKQDTISETINGDTMNVTIEPELNNSAL